MVLALAVTVVFAAGAALVELPCTAGFPVIWTKLLTEAAIGGAGFAVLLAAYLLVYLSVEMLVVAMALVTMRITRLQEAHGRDLKLVGGMVMAAMAVVLLVDPSLMERMDGSFYIVGGAARASGLVMAWPRLYPRRQAKETAGERPAAPEGSGRSTGSGGA